MFLEPRRSREWAERKRARLIDTPPPPVDVMEFSCLYCVSPAPHTQFICYFFFFFDCYDPRGLLVVIIRNDINTSCLFGELRDPLFCLFLNVTSLNGPIPPKIFPYYRSANPVDGVNTPAIAAIVASSNTMAYYTTALVIISFNKRNKSLIGPG